ncbi:uncharacterized protein LOC144716588 [Wolffia australiana]
MAIALVKTEVGSCRTMEILGCRRSSYELPSRKKPRLSTYITPTSKPKEDIFQSLPDECLRHVFSFLPSLPDRRRCAAVSRRWLHLQASMRHSDFSSPATSNSANLIPTVDDEINDARLALLAVSASSGAGSLGELVIRADVIQPTPSSSSLLSITDEGLKIISPACSELRRLTLWGCSKVGKEGLSAIAARCPKLEHLVVSCSPSVHDDCLIPFAAKCRNLSFLGLDRCPALTDRALHAFAASSPKLETFSLSRCPRVTHSGLASVFSSLRTLSKIAVSGCPALTDRTLSLLPDNLETLKLDKCHAVTSPGLSLALGNSSATLKSLSLVNCRGLGDGAATGFPLEFRQLKRLEISDCPDAGDELLLAVAAAAPGLRRITLRAADGVTDEGVLSLLQRLRGLSRVDLSRCRRITDRSVAALASSAGGSLVSLALEGCELVTDRGLALVARLCPRLAELDLTNCRRITDSGVAALAEKAALELLSLEGCDGISDVSLPCLEEMAGNGSLVSINLKRCSGLSRAAIDSVHHHLWWCDFIC